MYERFTDRARKVMGLANQESVKLNHEFIGTEHILLGLIREDSGVAATVLKNLGISTDGIRTYINSLVKPGPEMVLIGKISLTPRAKAVILKAMESARNLNHNYVGTEHLLLGLIRTEGGISADTLIHFGLTDEIIQEEIVNLLGLTVAEQRKIRPLTYLEKVEELAIRGHTGQKRSNGKEYISHPISVKDRLASLGICHVGILATALCHDLLEDTEITPEEIEKVAGKEVLECVKQLTNIVQPEKGIVTFERKHASMLSHAKNYNDISKIVKIVDRYDNLADAIWEWEPKRVKRYAKAGLELIEAMQPFPEDMLKFEKEARRFFECLV